MEKTLRSLQYSRSKQYNSQVVPAMIIPIVNMDVTPLVQLLVFVSYIGLVYGLSVEILGYHPFQMMKRTIQAKPPPAESEIPQEKANINEDKIEKLDISRKKHIHDHGKLVKL